MIVLRPRGFAGFAGLGAASDWPWFRLWTSSGHNDGGSILNFIAAQPDGGDPWALAAATGKSIPYGGQVNYSQTTRPALQIANPPSTGAGVAALWLDGPVPSGPTAWFVHPGDDVMAAAIEKWIPYTGSSAPAPAFSQAVPVMGGQTAAQAAAIQAINEQALASIVAQQTAPAAPASSVASTPGAAPSFLASLFSGAPASSQSAATGFSISSVPAWAWGLGAVAVLYFMVGGSHGR